MVLAIELADCITGRRIAVAIVLAGLGRGDRVDRVGDELFPGLGGVGGGG
jgi:hypothetical protein